MPEHEAAPEFSVGRVVATTNEQLQRRAEALAPLVDEYDRIAVITAAFGELPTLSDQDRSDDPVLGEHADLIEYLNRTRSELESRARRLEPLVQEHEQILHILHAYESAAALPSDQARRRRGRARRVRSGSLSATAEARQEELRQVLVRPRTRAELAKLIGLSPSRVTELLESMTQAGDVVEIRDADRRSRKLWVLATVASGSSAEGVEEVEAGPGEAA